MHGEAPGRRTLRSTLDPVREGVPPSCESTPSVQAAAKRREDDAAAQAALAWGLALIGRYRRDLAALDQLAERNGAR
jgi:hypothetical protein